MKHSLLAIALCAAVAAGLRAQSDDASGASPSASAPVHHKHGGSKKGGGGGAKVEVPHPFFFAIPDPLRGDWQGEGDYVAQVIRVDDKVMSVDDQLVNPEEFGKYEAHLFHRFDVKGDHPVAILHGAAARVRGGGKSGPVRLEGDGWTGTIEGGHFKATDGKDSIDLRHVYRAPPTLGQKPPAGAVVLFDGSSMDAWAHRSESNWLQTDGPANWNLLKNGVMEIAPNFGYLNTRQSFGAYKLHLEFRTLGGPTNNGIYLQCRYEAKILETYGSLTANPTGQFANCTEKSANPGIRCARPVYDWQTMDIEFHPAKFDASGTKTADAWATEYLNGTLYYDHQKLGPLLLNAARYGEAATGPIMLQNHGMPTQFRNIWLVELPD